MFDWEESGRKHAVVLVLGDVGRSPRMQYHALSLCEEAGCKVTLVGYSGEKCFEAIRNEERIRELRFDEPKTKWRILKLIQLLWPLFSILFPLRNVRVIMVQTPPAIPILFIAWLFAKKNRGARLIYDFHNLGFTLVQYNTKKKGIKTSVYKYIEMLSARLLNPIHNICVSKAMRIWLATNFKVDATVFHDRPPRFFFAKSEATKETLLTLQANGLDCLKHYTPGTAVLITSTSWSPDEDFSLLLEALLVYRATLQSSERVLIIITGKGPLRSTFEQKIQDMNLTPHILILCTWLESSDYLALLKAAHAGICLHASSSGLDLPMKVLDMFGAGLPVLALHFPALPELLVHNHNGLTFQDADSLATSLSHLLYKFDGHSSPTLDRLKPHSNFAPSDDWHANWRRSVLPLLPS